MNQDFDPRDLEPSLPPREPPRKRFRLAPVALAVIALGGFGGVVYYAYQQGARQTTGPTVAPLIKAEDSPLKRRPEEPGGMDVPHQDKLVLNAKPGQPPQIERLLPPPEAPAPRPLPQAAPPLPPAPPQSASLPPPITGNQAPPPIAAPRPGVQAQSLPGSAQRGSGDAGAAPVPAGTLPTPTSTPAVSAPAQTQIAAARPPAAPPQPAPPAPVTIAPPRPPTAAAGGGGGFRIQLAAVRSQEAAQAEWSRLQKTYPELASLGMNTARVDLGPDKGIYFRIQAGPLADAGSADRLCDQLKAKKQGCMIVKP